MRLAKAYQAGMSSILQHLGIAIRHPPAQQGRSGLGWHSGGIEQILPTGRHPVKRPEAQPRLHPPASRLGLGQGAFLGQTGVDAVSQRMLPDCRQVCLGQRDRIDFARTDPPPKLCRAHSQPSIRHVGPFPVSARTVTPHTCMDNPEAPINTVRMEHESDILIIGGGLNGPALALALADQGFCVKIIDALPANARASDDFDGRSYALALASQRLLAALGLWDHLCDNSQPILEVKVTDGRAGEGPAPFMLHMHHGEIEEGPLGYMLEDRFLYRALADAIAAHPAITLISGRTVTDQETDATGATITLDCGEQHCARLLAGCDGRRSGTAQRAGIRRQGHDYGQTALVCAIEHETPHNGIAHQFFMPSGPLAILPLPGRRTSIVWSTTTEEATRINALPDAGYLEVLKPRFGSFLGTIRLAGKRFTYPLDLTLAERYVVPRVALVGDAAHGVHPIAGQGLNLGLRDVAALAEVLTEARRRGEDFASLSVLERYQRWRRFDSTVLALGMDTVNMLFSNDNSLLRLGRDLGLGLVNALPALKRRFIREAAGLAGDLPRLMQGRPI